MNTMNSSGETLLIEGIGQLVTVDPARAYDGNPLGVIPDAAILIRNGRIAWLGPASEAKMAGMPMGDIPSGARIDAQGALAMPGLIDSHTHAIFAGDRADEFEMRLQGKSYLDIAQAGGGILKTVRATREATKDTLARLTWERLLRMLTLGVTTVEVKSGYGLDAECEIRCLEALRELQGSDLPVDIVPTYMGAHDIPPEYAGRTDAYVDWLCGTQIPDVAARKLATFCDVFCEKGYFDAAQSRRILETARRCGLKLKIHAEEFADCGGSVLAGELGAASADHLLNISDEGIAALKGGGVVATLLPGTAFYLRIKEYAPAEKLLRAGVPVALATDFNPGSCTIDSLQWMMALACLQMNMSPVDVIRAVTVHAARALDLHQDRGCLAVGMRADIALFAVQSYQELLYRMGSNRLTGVVSNGVYRDRAALEVLALRG